MGLILTLFNVLLIDPMLNVLVVLYAILFSNFGLSIISFTVIVRLATLKLHIKQIKSMKAMSSLQPKMKEIQARYSKDSSGRSKAMMALYKQEGINPLGCLGPMMIQLPIWVGLYQALLNSLGTTPNHLIGLSQRLYSWNPLADGSVPLNSNFLWLDLANPDPTPILPVLVGVSTWVQQKMTTMPSSDPRQASTNNMMLWMMPLMLAFFAFTFPSGLALYWVISNVVGVAIQYFYTGRDLSPLFAKANPIPQTSPQPVKEVDPEEIESDGVTRSISKNRGRSNRSSPERARRKSGRSRSRNTKPR